MAKQKNTPARVDPHADAARDASDASAAVVDAVTGAGDELGADSPEADEQTAIGEAAAVEGDASEATDAVGAGSDELPPDEQLDPPGGETVPALVLSDNHLGKVGQVIQVNAAHAEALRGGGLIDTHPNAIKAATPED